MPGDRRIEYAGSVHDEEEIDAVVAVLRGGPTALRIGKNVNEMERLVAASFGKQRGIMVNSGSSALYLAVELLGLEPGDEVITSAVTFSTDIAPLVRAGSCRCSSMSKYDTYQIDVDAIEARDRSPHPRDPRARTSSATAPTGTASATSPIATTCR